MVAIVIDLARRRLQGVLPVLVWFVLTFILLATSPNEGTGFGLPLIVVALVLAGAALPWRARAVPLVQLTCGAARAPVPLDADPCPAARAEQHGGALAPSAVAAAQREAAAPAPGSSSPVSGGPTGAGFGGRR